MMDDNSKMPFGEHKGKALVNVPAGYLVWLSNQSWVKGDLRKYLDDNREVLLSEAMDDEVKKKENGGGNR